MSGEPRRTRCTEPQDAFSGGSDTLWALLMLLLIGPLGAMVFLSKSPSEGPQFPWGTTLLGLVFPLEVISTLAVQTWLENRRLRRPHAA